MSTARRDRNIEIRGLRAIIIDGASGFARATAERFAAGGGSVAILDCEQSAGADVAAALGGTWHPTDVLDFGGIAVVIDEGLHALGGLDVASTPPAAPRQAARCVSR